MAHYNQRKFRILTEIVEHKMAAKELRWRPKTWDCQSWKFCRPGPKCLPIILFDNAEPPEEVGCLEAVTWEISCASGASNIVGRCEFDNEPSLCVMADGWGPKGWQFMQCWHISLLACDRTRCWQGLWRRWWILISSLISTDEGNFLIRMCRDGFGARMELVNFHNLWKSFYGTGWK